MFPKLKKLISLILSLSLLLQQSVFAQTVSLNLANYLNQASLPVISDTFRPVHLRYLFYDSISNDFKLLIDKGDFLKESPGRPVTRSPEKQEKVLESETQNLLRYFFIGLALPNDKFWVNLRPDAPENIIDEDLAKTDIGRIFLEADVQLKKDTASWTSPQTKEGKEYWDKLYKKAGELFGTENITIPTLTRPWIVPDEIILRESPEGAYVYKATLKVMLEEDYLRAPSHQGTKSPGHQVTRSPANLEQYSFKDVRLKEVNEYSTRLIKETIIPKLTREINSSKRYAPLRQVYYSLILAQHFKKKLANKSSPYSNLIDSRDLTNLTSQESWDKLDYFREYQKSFQEGEYNLKASQPTAYGQTVRRYMSGGIMMENAVSSAVMVEGRKELPGFVSALNSLAGPYIIAPGLPGEYYNTKPNIVSSAIDSDLRELIFEGFEGKPKVEILKEVIGSLQQKAKKIEEEGKGIKRKNDKVNFFEEYRAFKESMYEEYKGKLDDIASTKRNVALIEKVKEFGELLDKFRVKVINIVKNDNKEKVFFSGENVSIFYDLADKLNKAMHYPYYIEYGAKVNSFIRVMDAYIKLLSDIQNPEKIEEEYAKRMDKRTAESTGEPKLTYRLLKEYNKLLQEEKLSALPKKIKEAEIEKILKTFSLNNPNWLEESLKNKIAEDYGGLSVLEPIITDQYGQWNNFLRLPDETMDNLKAQLNEKAREYFYLPVITKHWIKILTSQYWVNSYNYKVIIAKKPALEKAFNYTYRNIVEGNDDVLFLWEFTVRLENEPPTIILEQQGLYKGLRGQGFISEAYPLFVQCLAEKFPGWQVEGEFENPAALALFKNNFLEPRPLNSIKGEEPDNAKSVIWNARIPPFNLSSSSSSSSSVDNPGGIDLTALPITTQSSLNQPMIANIPIASSDLNLNRALSNSRRVNLDNELRQIQDMLKAGIMPSGERIKEYALASSSLKPEDYSREIDRLLGCIADVFRLEEEKAKPTPQALKDALILLESDSSA